MNEVFNIQELLEHIMSYIPSFTNWQNAMLICKHFHIKLLPKFKQKLKSININKFVLGRMFQFILDMSQEINIRNNIKNMTISEIIDKAHIVTKKAKKITKDKNPNLYDFTLIVSQDNENKFYFGRCVQFLFYNSLIYSLSLLEHKGHKKTIDIAHKIKTKLILETMIQIYDVGDKCEMYCTWEVGYERCRCGNRRLYLDYSHVKNLDDSYVKAFPVDY